MVGIYRCVCGKEFTNPQGFNGHKAHCRIHFISKHGSDEKYIKSINDYYEFRRRGRATSQSRCEKKKQHELDLWISEKHTCEKCGKVMTEKFATGRFCSRSCANSKKHSEDTKRKISQKLSKNKPIRFCKNCGNKLSKDNETGYCIDCYRDSPVMKEIMHLSAKKSVETMRKRGIDPRWPLRNVSSYPEKFWMNVLDDNRIPYIREYKILHDGQSNYYLDFLIEKGDHKIDLEIDGQQHELADRMRSDQIRDTYLNSLGYLVYRVKWNYIKSEKGLSEMQIKIKKFIDYYNAL